MHMPYCFCCGYESVLLVTTDANRLCDENGSLALVAACAGGGHVRMDYMCLLLPATQLSLLLSP